MHRITAKTRAGLSLIEMLVAIGIGCMVLLALAIILVSGQRSMDRTLQQADLQRDASRAMLKMKRFIRSATNAEVNADGNEVTIYYASRWIRFWFVPARKELQYQLQGENEQMLLDGIVENAAFEIDPTNNKTLNVDLELQNGYNETKLSSVTMMRNCTAGT
jgi:type II secretory pathway component PulJ